MGINQEGGEVDMAWCITNTTSETETDTDADTDAKTDGVCTVAVSNLKLSDSGGRRAFFLEGAIASMQTQRYHIRVES